MLGQADYHLDWRANIYMAQLILWQIRGNADRAAEWLALAETPSGASNHFQQLQHRNLARAHFICGNTEEAEAILNQTLAKSRELDLVADNQRNLTLLACVLEKAGKKEEAESALTEATNISTATGMTVCFYLDRVELQPVFSRLAKQADGDQLIRHQARTLLESMNRNSLSRAVHFDEELVEKLLASETLPEAVRTSPLTLREWQVLGLIYSGFSNDQISAELDVAPTTIKTHIRNLYQKLQIANRDQAIAIADKLIKAIHY